MIISKNGQLRLKTNLVHHVIISFLLLAPTNSEADTHNFSTNQDVPVLQDGIYVIVASFQIKENALRYARSTRIKGKRAGIGKHPHTGMFYVYSQKFKKEITEARKTRAELRGTNKYFDAWLLYIGKTLDEYLEMEQETKNELIADLDLPIVQEEKEEIEIPKPDGIIPPSTDNKESNTFSYQFSTVSATSLREVDGYVTIVDAARNKAMKSVSTNQVHQIAAPTTQTKEVIAICDIFGYVKDQVKFRIDNPMSSPEKARISNNNGTYTVKYELSRHKAGDILTMYHVYFYNNSAIMKLESRFELNSLLSMLKENDKLEIKIHGHTNGNSSGKIIKLKEDDNNFFEVTSNNEETFGSAVSLSKVRADIIRRWLIEQGIDKKRMTLKGWGGKKMIYPKTDRNAGKNVRVEIEILKD